MSGWMYESIKHIAQPISAHKRHFSFASFLHGSILDIMCLSYGLTSVWQLLKSRTSAERNPSCGVTRKRCHGDRRRVRLQHIVHASGRVTRPVDPGLIHSNPDSR